MLGGRPRAEPVEEGLHVPRHLVAETVKDQDDGHAVTAPVGSCRANAFGVGDMHGNVWEWCVDRYGSYRDAPADGSPRTREEGAPDRVFRGGSFCFPARLSRSAIRSARGPGDSDACLGIRPAADVP